MNLDKILLQRFKAVKFLIFNTIFAYFLFGYVAFQTSQNPHTQAENADFYRKIFLFLSALVLATIPWQKKIVDSQKKSKLAIKNNISDEVFFINKLSMSNAVAIGASQVPAVWGMIVTMSSKNMMDFYFFSAISLFSFFLNFPKLENWKERLRKFEDSKKCAGMPSELQTSDISSKILKPLNIFVMSILIILLILLVIIAVIPIFDPTSCR